MRSYQLSDELYEPLAAVLRHTLPAQYECEINTSGSYPLLLVQGDDDAAGFAIVTDTPRQSYEGAYSAYKRLYHDRHEHWNQRNLSFVVVRTGASGENDFFARIETDPYFCKKYVLRLYEDRKAMRKELLRLPFLPLPSSMRVPGPQRPPAAESLLQRVGVSADLARKLLAPHYASAESIANMALDRADSLAPAVHPEKSVLTPVPSAHPHVRLKKVVIEGFRAYNRRQEFDVNADCVVIYGPNGMGKTSFFDAIDYACTGKIARLGRSWSNDSEFKQIAMHLETQSPHPQVRIELQRDAQNVTLVRTLSEWSVADVDGKERDRTAILRLLTAPGWGGRKMRVDNFERLFRATHFFAQTAPEFLADFQNRSRLPADLVARMFAMDDYAAGMRKSDEVLKILEQRRMEAAERAAALDMQITTLAIERDALTQKVPRKVENEHLRQAWEDLSSALRDHGYRIPIKEVELSGVAQARALLEGAVGEAEERVIAIRTLNAEWPQYQADVARLVEANERVQASVTNLDQERAQLAELDMQLTNLGERRSNAATELETARAQSYTITEALRYRRDVHKWTLQLVTAKAEHESIRAREARCGEARENALDAYRNARHRRSKATDAQQKLQIRLEGLRRLRDQATKWRAESHARERVRVAISEEELTLDELTSGIRMREEERDGIQRSLVRCESEYDQVTATQTDHQQLLAQLERFVWDASCPACGVRHASQEELLASIRTRKNVRDPRAEALVRGRERFRAMLMELDGKIGELQAEYLDRQLNLEKLYAEKAEHEARNAAFVESCRDVDIVAPEEQVQSTADIRIQECERESSRLRDIIAEIDIELNAIDEELEQLSFEEAAIREEGRAIENEIETLEALLRPAPEMAGANQEPATSELEDQRVYWERRAADLSGTVEACDVQAEALERMRAELRRSIWKGEAECDARMAERARILTGVSRFEESFRAAGSREKPTQSTMARYEAEAVEESTALAALLHRAIALEISVDASARSARAAELNEEVKRSAREKSEAEVYKKKVDDVHAWFDNVRNALVSTRSEGVKSHVRAFGPLATVLQKRLRPVYGFGDVVMRARREEIEVFVQRGGSRLRPTDYFSESQTQILMLSLFLAMRLTQTWSAFAPILLDDPVTHFDDVNAFAFVEMMRGLINSSGNDRQFVISTCEERLFDLLRDKLGGDDERAKFYRFEGITADGPVVTRVRT